MQHKTASQKRFGPMDYRINEKALDERLEELERAKKWSPRVVSRLESFIRTEDDFQMYRINPLRFAVDRGISEDEAIDLFLYGTKAGLFRMRWELVCPVCGAPIQSFAELRMLRSHYFCVICQIGTDAALDDFIQVNFTIASQVRDIAYHHPETLSDEDFVFRYHFGRGTFWPDGTPFLDVAASSTLYLGHLEPGEQKQAEVDLTPGMLVWHDFTHDVGDRVPVQGESRPQGQALNLRLGDGLFEGDISEAAPGRLKVRFQGHPAVRAVVGLTCQPLELVPVRVVFDPFLTGKRLLNTQTFRDLFRWEVIEGTEGLSVKDLTIMFTDLKGSTSLYDRIGDLNAFRLVSQHFESLRRVIAEHSGAIVKTIGDAVMASFISPADGVRSALQILEEIGSLNRELGGDDLILKLGIHRGPLIAVTLNDRLDYFGQTVNIASRVQNLANAEEIWITDAVFDSTGVTELLRDRQLSVEDAHLRGIEQVVRVYRISRPT
jgi:class 3 adenylate cyclase